MAMLLSCQSLGKSFGPRPLFENVSLSVEEGDRLGLIGPNGSGKSTLLKLLAGRESPDAGTVTTRKALRLAYVPQRDDFPDPATPLSVVTVVIPDSVHDEHDREVRARRVLQRVGFPDSDASVAALSGGWRKRLAIARALAAEPDVLLMDEPTNHLDLEGILWLEELLDDAPFAAVVVTHDRYFLEEVCSRVVELSGAYPEGTFGVAGPYSEFLGRKAEFLAGQAKAEQALAGKVRADLAWLRRGAKARRTKAKGRIQDAGDRLTELADLKSRNAPARAAAIEFGATGRQTRNLLVAQGIAKSLGGKPLFTRLDLTLSPGVRLGLLGPNGSGKTSLIRVLTGELPPDAGTIKRADALRVVTFTQHREDLDPRQQLRDALSPVSDVLYFRGQPIHVNTWAQRFLFRPDQLNTSVGDLSGGEQARILIARLMLLPADLLVLDEPTNDLDIPSLEVLEASLEDFPGALLLVTHDRFMLDRLSTHVLGLDGAGGAKMFPNYAQWQAEQDRRDKPSPARDEPRPTAASPAPSSTGAASSAALPVALPGAKAKRLGYKEQREWDTIEATILAAEEKVKFLEARLADPKVLADHRALHDCSRDLGAAQAAVAALYERWAELEAKQK